MRYNSRSEVELIGKTGICSYNDTIESLPIIVSRQLSSYWVASNPTDESISKHLKGDGFWEAWITLWVSRNVAPYSRCINAGANYGYYTFMLAQHGCDVTAIEANPELIPYMYPFNINQIYLLFHENFKAKAAAINCRVFTLS